MPNNSEIILSSNTHPGDSTEVIITGEKYKGDGYYGRSDGFHTVQYTISGFVGTIDIQATLATIPETEDWFTILTNTYPLIGDESETTSEIDNFTGNYVWVRAVVTYTDGTVNSIVLNH